MNIHNNNEHTENTADTLASIVLAKIHNEKISPTTKRYFTIRDIFLWVPGITVTIVGAFAWAGILFNTMHSSFKYREFISPKTVPFLVKELPTVWILMFLVFSLVILKAFRQTKQGYKYSTITVLGASLGLSFFLGWVIYQGDTYYKNPILRFPTEHIQKNIWSNPEEGRLTGYLSKQDDGVILLIDRDHRTWVLDTTDVYILEETLNQESMIRILGKIQNERTFLVCAVLPNKIDKKNKQINHLAKKQMMSISIQCGPILEEIRQHQRERKY
jgi:hypothetical protein